MPQALIDRCAARSPTGGSPTQIAQIAAMPLAASGKIDKNRLRADYASGKDRMRRAAIELSS